MLAGTSPLTLPQTVVELWLTADALPDDCGAFDGRAIQAQLRGQSESASCAFPLPAVVKLCVVTETCDMIIGEHLSCTLRRLRLARSK